MSKRTVMQVIMFVIDNIGPFESSDDSPNYYPARSE